MGRLDNLSERQIKFLTYLVYLLLMLLTVGTIWNVNQIAETNAKFHDFKETLPQQYVLKERYLADQQRLERAFDKTDAKLDRIDGKIDQMIGK